jgi:hypothetical protein
MLTHVNLMSEKAQFHAAARRVALRWALALGAVALVLTPIGGFAWQRRRTAMAEQEMLESQYEPIRQLTSDIRRLRTDAEQLVRNKRTALELSRERPPATLLALLGASTSATEGELFIQRLTLTQIPVRNVDGADDAERLAIEVSSSVSYDIQRFVKALANEPLTEVKILSTESAASETGSRKVYGIEASY